MNEILNKILMKLEDGATKHDIAVISEQLEAIVLAVNRIEKKLDSTHDQVVLNSESTTRIEDKFDDQTNDVRGDVRFLNHRVADLEMELDKLKNR